MGHEKETRIIVALETLLEKISIEEIIKKTKISVIYCNTPLLNNVTLAERKRGK